MRLRNSVRLTLCCVLLCGAGALAGVAQTTPAGQVQGQGQTQGQVPSLTVDRDPVPSPDGDGPTKLPEAGGQTSGGAEVQRQRNGYTLRTNVGEVRLNASVLDGNGRVVQTLTRDAFHVYEDGTPQNIVSFRHEDLPVSLGILIDSSGSMYDKRTAVAKASLDLIKLSNSKDEAFLVDFSFEPYIDQDFTSDIRKLEAGLSYVKASGGTALYDAVVASADYLARNAKQPKQVILLITDGDDNASTSSLEETIKRVQSLDGPVIYCVGLLFGPDEDKRESRHAKRVLQSLAEQTGGIAYFPRRLDEVDQIASEVAADIRQQYTISYQPTKPARLGGYRQVHVDAREKGFNRLTVRTRSGYFPKADAGENAAAGGAQ